MYHLLAAPLILACTGLLTWWRCCRYEFHHRTGGGVVLFPSFGASVWHHVKKSAARFASILGLVGCTLAVAGLAILKAAPNRRSSAGTSASTSAAGASPPRVSQRQEREIWRREPTPKNAP